MIFHSCVCLWSQVLGTHLFDSPPFQNLIVNGLVLAVCNLMMESSDSRLHNNLSPQLLCEMNVKEELTQHNAFGILVSFFFSYLFPATEADGKKMSKRLKNYPDPQEFGIDQFFCIDGWCASSYPVLQSHWSFGDMLHGTSYGKESYAKLMPRSGVLLFAFGIASPWTFSVE